MTEAEKAVRSRVKARLAEYYDKALERRLLEKELKDLEAQGCGLGSPTIDGMPRGSSTSDPTARTAVGSVMLQNLYEGWLQQIKMEQADVERQLEILTARERVLMRLRYIKGQGWAEICELMNYSWSHVHRIHSDALDKMTAREMGQTAHEPQNMG